MEDAPDLGSGIERCEGSSPSSRTTTRCSSVGRTPALGAGGRRFKSCHFDHTEPTKFARTRVSFVGIFLSSGIGGRHVKNAFRRFLGR